MKKLVVRGIKIFFLLFFSYINKNFSCDCCDECWEIFFPDKKPSSKYSDKIKKNNVLSIIDEDKEEGENEEEENKKEEEDNKSEEEENKPEEEENKPEEEEHGSNEKEKNDEINNDKYLEEVLENFDKVRVIENDFFNAQDTYVIEKSGTIENDGVLGRGCYGVVYKIKKNGKIFALKKVVVMSLKLETLEKEIRNLIRFRNEKNILRIVDVYRQDNFVGKFLKKKYSKKDKAVCFYIITEYCKNGDLYDFIKKKKIPNKKKLNDKFAYQIINAVHSCYSKNIAHRDLKPANFFLDKNYNVNLGDFGLSAIFRYDEKTYSQVGAQRYQCYEKSQNMKHDPFKADLYALGVTLYELYTELSYSKGEWNSDTGEYDKDYYTNENVKRKLNKNLKDGNYKNLKILLTGLLQQFEEDRWGWKEIFKSEFYRELKDKYKE